MDRPNFVFIRILVYSVPGFVLMLNTLVVLTYGCIKNLYRGQYYYRFGSIHANIIGIEVVLADGTILGKH